MSRNFQPGQIYGPADGDLANDLWGPFVVQAVEEGYLYIIQAIPLAGAIFEVRDNWPTVQEVEAYLDNHPIDLQASFPELADAVVELRGMLARVDGYAVSWEVIGVPEPEIAAPRLGAVEDSLERPLSEMAPAAATIEAPGAATIKLASLDD